MNKQIVYIAIYRVLECLEEENENKSNELSAFLDMANPYVFKDRKSADPIFYDEFSKWIDVKNIKISDENSFNLAEKYIEETTAFKDIFSKIDEEEWKALIEIIKSEEPQLVNE